MNKSGLVKISEIAEIVTGNTPSMKVKEYYGGNIPWVKPAEVTSQYQPITETLQTLTEKGAKKARVIPKDSILITCIGNIGRVGIAGTDLATNQQINSLVLNESVMPDYIFFALKYLGPRLENSSTGTTLSIVNKTSLGEFKIPVPEKKLQNEISKRLMKIENIQARKRILKGLYEELLESSFVKLFENSLKETKSFHRLSKLLDKIENGWSPVCQKEPAKEGEYGVLKLSAVSYGVYNPKENKAMKEGSEPKLNCEVEKGDFLFTRKNTYELVGACAYVQETPPRMMLPDIIFRLKIKDENELNPIFLWGLFNNSFFREKIRKLASGSAGSMPNISKQRLLGLEIPVPDIKKQKKYAEIYKKVRELQDKNKLQEKEIVNLQRSLSSKYFN